MTHIRSSKPYIVNSHALRIAPSSLQEEIHLFLKERRILDIVVGQPIRNIEQVRSLTTKIFVGRRLAPVPSGFLIVRPDSPVIYWNTKLCSAHIVKIALDRRQLERAGPLVLSATYYGNECQLILEDVLYYNSTVVWEQQSLTERWKRMNMICQTILRPDAGHQGFDLSVARYMSLTEWLENTIETVYLWEFIVDIPNHRRLLWRPEREDTRPTREDTRSNREDMRPTREDTKPNREEDTKIHGEKQTGQFIATIEKDPSGLPDAYLLFGAHHTLIGPAAIKKLSTSMALRNPNATKVRVEYNDKFKKYEVIEVLFDNNLPPAP